MQEAVSKSIDILVKCIDNFGDFGFALDFAESLLTKNPSVQIRFFADNEKLFSLLTQGRISDKITYFPLEKYSDSKPSETVILCFDMKADMDFFMEQSYKIHIYILSYLRFDDGVGSMNNTSYSLDNITITHLVPSARPDGAGIVVRSDLQARTKMLLALEIHEARTKFFSEIRHDIPSEISKKEWVSVFCYSEGQKVIREYIASNESETTNGTTWIFFEDCHEASLETLENGNSIWHIPYLRFDEYEILLSLCDRNIVRGENSAMKALLAGKPFLWDIYKESNDAHFGKLEEFFDWLAKNSWWIDKKAEEKEYLEWMKKLFLQWNTKPTSEELSLFLQRKTGVFIPPIGNLADEMQNSLT